MKLYHGSYIAVTNPDIFHSRSRVDFGSGFYTTPLLEQARQWALRVKRQKQSGVISVYDFAESALAELSVLQFTAYSEAWLDFVINCRTGKDGTNFDIVIGGVANDRVFDTIELYLQNLIEKKETLRRLRFEEPNMQFCFRVQNVIETYLHYEEYYNL